MVPNRNVIHAIYKCNCRIWSAFRKNKEYIHKHIEKWTINNIQLSVKQELTPISHLAVQSATTRLQQGRWRHSNGCLDKVGDQLPLVFTWALMSFTGSDWAQVHPGLVTYWINMLLWRQLGGLAHYLSPISDGLLPRVSGPIRRSISASGEKPNRCLPLCCVEATSSEEPGPPWNRLMTKKKAS